MATPSYNYRLFKTLSGPQSDSVNALKADPSGRYLASLSKDGTVALFDLYGGRMFSSVRLVRKYKASDYAAVAVTWGSDSNQLFVGFSNGSIVVYNYPINSGVSTNCILGMVINLDNIRLF